MKYFLYITGCDMNYSDAERVVTIFNEHGFKLTNSEKEADIILAVACSVREKAVHKILGKVDEWGRGRNIKFPISNVKSMSKSKCRVDNPTNPKYPIIIITGCILPEDRVKFEKKADLVFGIQETELLSCYLANLLKKDKKQGNNVTIQQCNNASDSKRENDYLSIKPIYQSKYSVLVPIMTGCDNFCSYCAVPYTRGREISRPEDEILAEVRDLVGRGYKEITLLGQNVNSYGVNNKFQITNDNGRFVQLLRKIDQLEGDYWVRFYSNHPKDMSDELIEFLKSSKHFCHYIHLPLQSGDDEILEKMNRHYTVKQYLGIIKKIRNEIPDCSVSTDIIVGFPGESKTQFENTAKLLNKVNFDMVFISEYSPRSETAASKMIDDVPKQEKTRRKKFLNDEVLAKSALKNNDKLVGRNVRVLIKSIDKNGFLKGNTEGLKDVRITNKIKGEYPSIGDFCIIKIIKANSWGLEGSLEK